MLGVQLCSSLNAQKYNTVPALCEAQHTTLYLELIITNFFRGWCSNEVQF